MGLPRTNVDTGPSVREAWLELVAQRPKLRQKDAADLLGVSEGELVASRCGHGVQRLRSEWRELLPSLARLGTVKTITRNAYAVHETVGVYDNVTFEGPFALVQSEGLDLRLLLNRWDSAFAVTDRAGSTVRQSLQFYDADGLAVHKIYPEEGFDEVMYSALVGRFADTGHVSCRGHARSEAPRPAPSKPEPVETSSAARQALIDDWSRLEDTHDFGAMLARHHVGRSTAMKLVEGAYTTPLPRSGYERVLDTIREAGIPVMVFVGNPGAVQIRTGTFRNTKRLGDWVNVLDPDFNLHVVDSAIAALWVVTKPTRDGVVTSIEAYAADGTEIAILYGKRKPGQLESAEWRVAVNAIRVELAS